jgi:predicted HicB family RNase H-like nuclease
MKHARLTKRFPLLVSPEMKKAAEKKALKNRQSTAEYIRELIEKDLADSSLKK